MVSLLTINEVGLARGLAYLRRVLILAFVIIFGVLAARLFWLIVEPDGSVSQTGPTSTRAYRPSVVQAGQSDISILFRDNPFAESAEAVMDVPDAPETTLNLKLIGMRAATVNIEGVAIIVTPDSRQSLYSPGEKILDNVYLESVLTDRVILKKNGVLETLFRNNHEGRFLVIGDEEMRNEPDERDTSEPRQAFNRQAFIQSVNFTPVSQDGQVIGYRVSSRGGDAIMQQVGLEDGDIVIVLNGLGIADIDQEALYGLLVEADQLIVKVKRGGVSVPVHIQFESGSDDE